MLAHAAGDLARDGPRPGRGGRPGRSSACSPRASATSSAFSARISPARRPQGLGDELEGLVLDGARQRGQRARSGARPADLFLDRHRASSSISTRWSRCTTSSSKCGTSRRASALRRPATRRRSRAPIAARPRAISPRPGPHDRDGVAGREAAVHAGDAHRQQAAAGLGQGARRAVVDLERAAHRLGVAQPELEGGAVLATAGHRGADRRAGDARRRSRPGRAPRAITVRTPAPAAMRAAAVLPLMPPAPRLAERQRDAGEVVAGGEHGDRSRVGVAPAGLRYRGRRGR